MAVCSVCDVCPQTTSGTQCRVLCPQSFGQLRAACGIDRGTLSRQVAASSAPSQSAVRAPFALSRRVRLPCGARVKALTSDVSCVQGQSSSYFYFSPSQAFILKTVSASEIDTLLEMLPSLCRYVVYVPRVGVWQRVALATCVLRSVRHCERPWRCVCCAASVPRL
jgi:hypothetical protein